MTNTIVKRDRHRRKLSAYEALQRLVSRIMVADLTDAERAKYVAAALVKARAEASWAIHCFHQLAKSFTDQVVHFRPIAKQLSEMQDDNQKQDAKSQAIYQRLRDTALRKMPAGLVEFLLDEPGNKCPCCGRKKP